MKSRGVATGSFKLARNRPFSQMVYDIAINIKKTHVEVHVALIPFHLYLISQDRPTEFPISPALTISFFSSSQTTLKETNLAIACIVIV